MRIIKRRRINLIRRITTLCFMALGLSFLSVACSFAGGGLVDNSGASFESTAFLSSVEISSNEESSTEISSDEESSAETSESIEQGEDSSDIIKNVKAAYRVEYYLQNLDGDGYALQSEYTQELMGTVDEMVSAEIVQIPHFTPTSPSVSGRVNENGTTVLKVYYNRNYYQVNLTGKNNNVALVGEGAYANAEMVTISAIASSGYSFEGWYQDETLVSDSLVYSFYPTNDITLSAEIQAVEPYNGFTLSTMSYNMKFEDVTGGGDPVHTWANRKYGIAESLVRYKADIVGTQELQCWQYEELMGLLGDSWDGVGLPRKNTNSERCSIIYNKKTIEYINGETIWLSETPSVVGSKSWNSAQPRILTYGKFLHKPSQTEFYFFNTHLDHKSEDARLNQLKLIVSYMDMYSKDYPVILTGDFNMYITDDCFTPLTEKAEVYDNSFTPFLQELGEDMKTTHGFKGGTAGEPIDFIFHTANVLEVQSTQIIRDMYQGTYYLSDHYPVHSVISISGKPNVLSVKDVLDVPLSTRVLFEGIVTGYDLGKKHIIVEDLDGTCAIQLYKNPGYALVEVGDLVKIDGYRTLDRGLDRIMPNSLEIIASGYFSTADAPIVIDGSQLKAWTEQNRTNAEIMFKTYTFTNVEIVGVSSSYTYIDAEYDESGGRGLKIGIKNDSSYIIADELGLVKGQSYTITAIIYGVSEDFYDENSEGIVLRLSVLSLEDVV